MTVTVTVETKHIETTALSEWDTACGFAVREAIAGAEAVVLQDSSGAQWYINAEPVEDNS